MPLISPPFMPSFGTGAPGANVPHNQPYFDTSSNPYVPYVYDQVAHAWATYGAAGGSGNAVSIQGIPVDVTAPTNGQSLVFDSVSGKYKPTVFTPTTGPSIVQTGYVTGTVGPVTMGVAPTQNNLLFAMVSTQGVNPLPGAGWTTVQGSNLSGTADDLCMYYKIAGAGESTTQTPTTNTNAGTVTLFELANATLSAFYNSNRNATGTAPTCAVDVGLGLLVLGVCSNHSAAIPPVSVTGGTFLDVVKTGGSRTQRVFKITAPVVGSNSITVNYGSSTTGSIQLIEIG